MTTPTVKHIRMVRGDYKLLRVGIVDEAGVAVSLTNATARWWLAKTADVAEADVPVKKSLGSGIAFNGSTVEVTVYPSDTVNLAAGDYYHELEIILDGGRPVTAMIGTYTLFKGLIP